MTKKKSFSSLLVPSEAGRLRSWALTGILTLAVMASTGCGFLESGSPTSPTSPGGPGNGGNNPSPDPDRYETLPAKHYLVGPDGNPTEMWVKLHWVRPERGSTVQIGPSACPDNCFRWSAEVGLDSIPGETNPWVKAAFQSWFSLDGENPIQGDEGLYRLNGGGVHQGESQMVGSNIIRMFQVVPKYILVTGRYQRSSPCPCPPGGNGEVVTGTTSFEVDYR